MTPSIDTFWRALADLERRTRTRAPLEAARDAIGFDDWQARLNRVQRIHSALFLSGSITRHLVSERLAGIDVSSVAEILLSACKDVAVVWGGSVLLGGAAGGAIGFFGFGAGAVPGAIIGAGVGTQVGVWALGLLGLKSLAEDLGTAIPQALRHYEEGFRLAWGPVRRWESDPGSERAPYELAQGHMVLTIAILSALAAYLTRGRGNPGVRARILQEIRESPRLGTKVADWVIANEDRLLHHPSLKPKAHQVTMAMSAKPPAGPPMTPSQLRQGAGKDNAHPPETKPAPAPPEARPTPDRPSPDRSVFAAYPQRTTLQFNSLQEQAGFLAANVPGLGAAQAQAILEAGFSRSSSVVFGGSRVRGNFKDASDLDVGFGSLSERQAQRVISTINNQGHALPLERLTIVPGKSTATIDPIVSPEEFFQRSGVRAGGDLRSGEPFTPSGSITATNDGRIVLIPPEQP